VDEGVPSECKILSTVLMFIFNFAYGSTALNEHKRPQC
jgi:hypothetical protein